jgi:hypothetical protein
MKALPFVTPQKGDALRLWQQLLQQQQQQQQHKKKKQKLQKDEQPALLDLLSDDLLGKVMQHVADCSQNYSHSLFAITRLCSAYRRAHIFERTFQYGHLILGCRPSLIPPPAWFQQRRHRISSITALVLPHGPLADVLASWGSSRHTLTLTVDDKGFMIRLLLSHSHHVTISQICLLKDLRSGSCTRA